MLAKSMDNNDKKNVKRIKDFFEALNFEVSIRSKDKVNLYE